MVRKSYQFCLFIALGGLLCHFALCAENNDSRLMYVSRHEYIRVIGDILNPPPESKQEDIGLRNEEDYNDEDDNGNDIVDNDSHRVTFLPESPALVDTQAVRKRKLSQNKRDSFFFLQRALERRSGGVTTLTSTA